MTKQNVAILMGGMSAEHEISLLSAQNVIRSLDRNRFEPILIGLHKNGVWFLQDSNDYLDNPTDPKTVALKASEDRLFLVPGSEHPLWNARTQSPLPKIDCVFPILHGPYGEDGAIQGLLKTLGLPFVGSDVLGTAIGMDKDVMKRLLTEAGIPNARFEVFSRDQMQQVSYMALAKELGDVLFVKPANMGSSVGIHKVKAAEELLPALEDAFQYDNKVIVEEFIQGREIECAVLGNENPKASKPGEIIVKADFYSYEAKYVDTAGAETKVPADLSEDTAAAIQKLAKQTLQVLCCAGLARVDVFVTSDDKIYVNEINTLPGFTNISMYPQMWQASGIGNTELVTQLIDLAVSRFQQAHQLKTSFT